LDGGRIVESGAHAELLVRGGVYSRLYRTQASPYAADRAVMVAPVLPGLP
jgi:ABC-type transport system involved in cytochrome bd biosynthesis fused ATPase/permease subunit